MSHDYTGPLSAEEVVSALSVKADEAGQERGDYAAGQQVAYEDAADIAHQAVEGEGELVADRDEWKRRARHYAQLCAEMSKTANGLVQDVAKSRELARDVAVRLEQENAELQRRLDEATAVTF